VVRLGSEFEYRDMANIIESVADPEGRGLRSGTGSRPPRRC
jgi:hypothetical protein